MTTYTETGAPYWTNVIAAQAVDNKLWADGLLGQEDELDDVHDGKLDPPTDNEGPGSIDEKNDSAVKLEKQDEDDELIEDEEKR